MEVVEIGGVAVVELDAEVLIMLVADDTVIELKLEEVVLMCDVVVIESE